MKSKVIVGATAAMLATAQAAMAHPGHGDEAGVPHAMDHVLMLAGFGVVAAVVGAALLWFWKRGERRA